MHNPRDSIEDHHSWNVVAFQHLLEYAEHYKVPKVVLLSSANVYGPRPDNPAFLDEDARRQDRRDAAALDRRRHRVAPGDEVEVHRDGAGKGDDHQAQSLRE